MDPENGSRAIELGFKYNGVLNLLFRGRISRVHECAQIVQILPVFITFVNGSLPSNKRKLRTILYKSDREEEVIF